jgi:hypothetical protein
VEKRKGRTRVSWAFADFTDASPASRDRVRMVVKTRARAPAATRTVSLMSSRTLKHLSQIWVRYFSYLERSVTCYKQIENIAYLINAATLYQVCNGITTGLTDTPLFA